MSQLLNDLIENPWVASVLIAVLAFLVVAVVRGVVLARLGARPETPAAPVMGRDRVDVRSTHCARAGRLPHLSGSMTLRRRVA